MSKSEYEHKLIVDVINLHRFNQVHSISVSNQTP